MARTTRQRDTSPRTDAARRQALSCANPLLNTDLLVWWEWLRSGCQAWICVGDWPSIREDDPGRICAKPDCFHFLFGGTSTDTCMTATYSVVTFGNGAAVIRLCESSVNLSALRKLRARPNQLSCDGIYSAATRSFPGCHGTQDQGECGEGPDEK